LFANRSCSVRGERNNNARSSNDWIVRRPVKKQRLDNVKTKQGNEKRRQRVARRNKSGKYKKRRTGARPNKSRKQLRRSSKLSKIQNAKPRR
jgi:hypothetical protein